MRRKLLRKFRIGEYHFDGDLNTKFNVGKLKSITFEFEDCYGIDVKKGKIIKFENDTGQIEFKKKKLMVWGHGEILSKADLKKINEIRDKIKMCEELAKGVGKADN